MFQHNPSNRLNSDDILKHEWMQGPMANANLVRDEFAERHQRIREEQQT